MNESVHYIYTHMCVYIYIYIYIRVYISTLKYESAIFCNCRSSGTSRRTCYYEYGYDYYYYY